MRPDWMAQTWVPEPLEERRARYVLALEGSLIRIAARLAAVPAIHKVILFGSAARSRRDLGTDLDLIVVMDTALDFLQRAAAIRSLLDVEVDLDLLVYTPAEFARMREHGFLKTALAGSKVLHEKIPA